MSTVHAPAPHPLQAPREAAAPILPLSLERWSPRSFTEEAMPREALLQVPEAVRWAAHAMAAIGRRGTAEQPPEGFRERAGPSARRPLADSIGHGAFCAP